MHQKPPGNPRNPLDRQHPNARLSVVNHCVTREPGGVCRAATHSGITLLIRAIFEPRVLIPLYLALPLHRPSGRARNDTYVRPGRPRIQS